MRHATPSPALPRRPSWRAVPAVSLAALALAIAACGGGAYGGPSTPAPAAPTTSDAGNAVTVSVASDGSIAPRLVGAGGRTLYVLTKDTPNTSTCTGSCASTWPPLVVGAGVQPAAGNGVSGTLGVTTRDDGSRQVTYNGAPLYYYAGDQAAGETRGQGIGGVWFVETPNGMATTSSEGSSGAANATVDPFGY